MPTSSQSPRYVADDQQVPPFKIILGAGLAFLALVFGLTVIFGSWYTIDATQRGVLLRNGAFVEVVQPGLHFKLPWVESVYKIDMQTHTFTYGKGANGLSDMEAYSADQQPAKLRTSVTLHVAPDHVSEMYTRFGGNFDDAVSRLISPHVYERTKVVFGTFTAAKAITTRGELNLKAATSLIESIAYDPMFVIESVQLEDITFSPEYIHSIEQRMQAEVMVQKEQQNLAREKVLADIAVTQANGRANSVRAEAQAEADKKTMIGDAEANAIKARAAALASNANLVDLVKAERWNGILPTAMIPGTSVPFLNVK